MQKKVSFEFTFALLTIDKEEQNVLTSWLHQCSNRQQITITTVRRLRACGTRVPMLHDFASFCCQLSTANDDLPCDVSVVVQRYSWRVDCVYLLRMSPLLRSFSTMDLCVSWIGQLDFELSAMLVYTSDELRDSACLG